MDTIFVTNPDKNTAEYVPLRPGMTAGEVFVAQMGTKNPADYLIRVAPAGGGAREVACPDRRMAPGESISFTPTKIQGA